MLLLERKEIVACNGDVDIVASPDGDDLLIGFYGLRRNL